MHEPSPEEDNEAPEGALEVKPLKARIQSHRQSLIQWDRGALGDTHVHNFKNTTDHFDATPQRQRHLKGYFVLPLISASPSGEYEANSWKQKVC